MELDKETQWVANYCDLANHFTQECRKLCDENPSNHEDPLGYIMNCTMTELWDFGFSQTEIRNAFLEAVKDMPRYAAGEERR